MEGRITMTRISIGMLMGLTLILAACTSTSEPDPGTELSGTLAGVWIFAEETADGAQVFTRAAALTGERTGFEFCEHGGLKVRTAGWCGTPPLTWSNLDGLWEKTAEGLLDIRHAWRGAPREYQLEIISLSSRRLVCRQRNDDG